MSDLATRIRDYYDAAADPVSATEIFGQHVAPLQPVRRQYRPAAVAGAAALLVLIAIGGAAWLGSLGGGGDIADESEPVVTTAPAPVATSVPPATITTTTTAPLDLSARAWAPVPGTGALFESAFVYGVTPYGDGMVAVGSVRTGLGIDELGGRPRVAVWTSPDGLAWSQISYDEVAFGGGAFEMWAVHSDGDQLVAVGHGCDDPDNPCPMRPTAWTSLDGSSWKRVAHDPAIFGLGGQMTDVATYTEGWISVGVACDEVACLPAAWTSRDGATWERGGRGQGARVRCAEG